MPSSRGSSQPRGSNWCLLSLLQLAGEFFTTSTTWETQGIQNRLKIFKYYEEGESIPVVPPGVARKLLHGREFGEVIFLEFLICLKMNFQ